MIQKFDKQHIDTAIKSIENIENSLAVLLVLNLRDENISNQGNTRFSILVEYFSMEEIDEIVRGFTSFASYIDVSYSETEFVNKLVSGKFDSLKYSNKIVYSATGSGIRKCKSSLIPNICDFYQLPYCSNDAYTSAFLENKVHAYSVLKYYGFPIAPFWIYDYKNGWHRNDLPPKNLLLIAKPAYQCSSIGIDQDSVSTLTPNFIDRIHDLSMQFNEPIIIQVFISGYEVEVPVIDVGEIITPKTLGLAINGIQKLGSAFVTYDKICEGSFTYFDFDEQNTHLSNAMKKVAKESYKIFDFTGIGRVDFRISEKGEYFISDYNNTPHLTEKNSCAKVFTLSGYSYPDMLKCLLYGGYLKIKKRSISGGQKKDIPS